MSQNPWKTPGMGSLAAAWLRMTGGREEQQGQMRHKTPMFGVFFWAENAPKSWFLKGDMSMKECDVMSTYNYNVKIHGYVNHELWWNVGSYVLTG